MYHFTGKPQVLTIFSHLAEAFINSQSMEGREQLGQRIWGILQKIIKAKDYPRGEDIQFSVLESLLKSNLKLAATRFKYKKSASNLSKEKQSVALNRYKMINSLSQSSTFWILKIIDAKKLPEPELQEVFGIFEGVLEDYFSKRSQLTSEFLEEVF
ncbi:PREDICTED: uncharacterized protein LOC109219727 [Nicotiana attenuata]|uniref:uncharacterized protein LOC109219727 n=1 Tax=Nicotiana attenuata TaxID=49451 RepID=UPI0009057799|nr:PREDICTED: uncharacterized protein LOC109219727 [Nicotiana attenuata]